MALARPLACPPACTLLVVASFLVALPALADPKAPAPDAKPAAEKTADAKSEAEPAAKPAKPVRRVTRKEGVKVVAKAKDPTAKDAAPASQVPSVDVGDTPITARTQAPIVQVIMERTPVVFSLHELAGPYREADAFKAP